ncbi:MAG: hypothetical protein DMF44_14455 [Verrucomicrobia bacterium]|nr:MAG: hypothetical protein DMF44_14455 [Verrucomicrobiota bacterium]
MKETIWSKLRELWAIRRRCKQIKLQQRENRLLRLNESHGRTRRLTKIISPNGRKLRSTGQSARFSPET